MAHCAKCVCWGVCDGSTIAVYVDDLIRYTATLPLLVYNPTLRRAYTAL